VLPLFPRKVTGFKKRVGRYKNALWPVGVFVDASCDKTEVHRLSLSGLVNGDFTVGKRLANTTVEISPLHALTLIDSRKTGWPVLHSWPVPKLQSQHQLPVGDVNPSTVLEAYLAKRGDPFETELFVQSHTRLVRKSRSADRDVYASSAQER